MKNFSNQLYLDKMYPDYKTIQTLTQQRNWAIGICVIVGVAGGIVMYNLHKDNKLMKGQLLPNEVKMTQ